MTKMSLLAFSLFNLAALSQTFASGKICETKDHTAYVQCEKGRFYGRNCKFYYPDAEAQVALKNPIDPDEEVILSEKRIETICNYLKARSYDSDVKTCIVGLNANGECGIILGPHSVKDLPEEP